MTLRLVLAAAVAAAALTAVAGTAAARPTGGHATAAVPHRCGTVSIKGRHWLVVSRGVACAKARALVRALAAKPRPANRIFRGTFLGMHCIDASSAAGPAVNCLSATASKQVAGAVRG